MDILLPLFAASVVATVWLGAAGATRTLAYRSGTDHTPGMRNVAVVALALGAVALVVAVTTGVLLLT